MPRLLAWLNGLVPLLAVGAGYAIALAQQQAPACVPFWEGCTSISRAVRNGDSLFWFRGLMLPLAPVLAYYWVWHRRWLIQLGGSGQSYRSLLILGTISAIALGLYVDFLGSEGDFYQFMRRFGITFYFAFGLLGQLLALRALKPLRHNLNRRTQYWVNGQWVLVLAQWALGLVSLSISLLQPENKYEAHNIVEWFFGLLMVSFYTASAMIWRDWRRVGMSDV